MSPQNEPNGPLQEPEEKPEWMIDQLVLEIYRRLCGADVPVVKRAISLSEARANAKTFLWHFNDYQKHSGLNSIILTRGWTRWRSTRSKDPRRLAYSSA